MYYIGFDLGDGESSLSYYDSDSPSVMPRTIPLSQSRSFATAVAVMKQTGETVIGNSAMTDSPNLEQLRVCFKRDFRTGENDVYESFRRFIYGVLAELRQADLPFDPMNREECRFVVGQPADWNAEVLSKYRMLLESCGIHDPYMVSESRAALVYCNTAKYMRICDPSVSNTLVCDFGSSTLDFAFSVKGDCSNVAIFGDPRLGGGLMDEQIVLESIADMQDEEKRNAARELFHNQKEIRARCMITARRIKEEFFLDPDMTPLKKSVPLYRQDLKSVVLKMDAGILERVIMYPQPILDNKSIYEKLQEQFSKAVEVTKENPPECILLTGGASRMGFFRELCSEAFQKSKPEIVFSEDPETDIANGLALDGCYAEKLRQLRIRLQEYVNGPSVETIIGEEMPELTSRIADTILEQIVLDDPEKPGALRTAFRNWKTEPAAQSMNDLKQMVEASVRDYCGTQDFIRTIERAVGDWLNGLLPRIQNDLDNICLDLHVSPAHVSLKRIKIKESIQINDIVFHPGTTIVDVLDTLVTGISALVVGAFAGGGGIAVICSGPVGVLIGIVAVVATRFLLERKAKEVLMDVKMPHMIRQVFSERSVFTGKSTREMEEKFEELLTEETVMKDAICKTLSDHVDAVILAVSSQTKV